jgi:hypothetical protein
MHSFNPQSEFIMILSMCESPHLTQRAVESVFFCVNTVVYHISALYSLQEFMAITPPLFSSVLTCVNFEFWRSGQGNNKKIVTGNNAFLRLTCRVAVLQIWDKLTCNQRENYSVISWRNRRSTTTLSYSSKLLKTRERKGNNQYRLGHNRHNIEHSWLIGKVAQMNEVTHGHKLKVSCSSLGN